MDKQTDWNLQPREGGPFVLSTSETVSLHFDGLHVQSAMSVEDPFRLHLHYTQAMMGFKLFRQDPANILIVGLGGGSLSKYCFRRFPEAHIVTLEISEDVLALRDRFRIPQDCGRFRVIHADAQEYMQGVENSADILLLDGFTASGIPENLCSLDFYRNCYKALADGGIVVANLLGDDARLHQHIGRLASTFNGNCLIGYANGCQNYILMARKGADPLRDDVVTDVRRLIVWQRKGLDIPYFETFANFYARREPRG